MFILLFALWIIFNGRITPEIVLLGIGIVSLIFLFLCRFMDYSIRKDMRAYRNLFAGIAYLFLLVAEIVKANFCVMKLIVSS